MATTDLYIRLDARRYREASDAAKLPGGKWQYRFRLILMGDTWRFWLERNDSPWSAWPVWVTGEVLLAGWWVQVRSSRQTST